jgi:hypothetical protein
VRGGPCRAAHPLVRVPVSSPSALWFSSAFALLCSSATAWLAWSGRVEGFQRWD